MKTKTHGLILLSFFAVHASGHLRHHTAHDLLWGCNSGTLLLGLGLTVGWLRLAAVGALWLSLGTPYWIFDVSSGGEFIPTSLLTHIGGLGLGLHALRQQGLPRGAWWQALLAMIPLQLLSRLLTPRAANVNLAWDIYPGVAKLFPSYPLYWASNMLIAGLVYFLVYRLLQRGQVRPFPNS